jgi:hypothetical protein
MVGPCKTGRYAGERCLIPGTDKADGRYPVTKGGQVDTGRIGNAAARAAQNGDTAAIKAGGFCNIAKRAGVNSSLCD